MTDGCCKMLTATAILLVLPHLYCPVIAVGSDVDVLIIDSSGMQGHPVVTQCISRKGFNPRQRFDLLKLRRDDDCQLAANIKPPCFDLTGWR